MRLTEARQGVRTLKFMDVFGRWEAATPTQLEAAGLRDVKAACSVWPSAQALSAGCVLR